MQVGNHLGLAETCGTACGEPEQPTEAWKQRNQILKQQQELQRQGPPSSLTMQLQPGNHLVNFRFMIHGLT